MKPSSATAQAGRDKGPRVWLDLDQKELDDAYDQSKYAANMLQIVKRYAMNSEIARHRLGPPERLSYGAAPIEGIDLYKTKKSNAPINIFIHGGAWRSVLARDAAFAAEVFVRAGAHFLVVDFNNVLETGGDLMPMARQVRTAIAWVYENAGVFGGDPNQIYISGHSSGAHLGGVMMVTDWEKEFGLPRDVVKGGLLCSGMFDLKPVRLSVRSSYVKFTDEMEQDLSSQRYLDNLIVSVIVAYGALETPEFQRQSRDFTAAAKAAGKSIELIAADGYNHFEVIETLSSPHGLLGHAALKQMKLLPESCH
jgi:arylformamidase